MRKAIIYMVFLVTFFTSCEEYYKPALDIAPGILVVESHVTNDSVQSFVKLSMTQGFYSQVPAVKITGAKVKLIEVGGQSMDGFEYTTGYFTFPETPVSGKKYLIRITYKYDIFESDAIVMPPAPTIDSLYTKNEIEENYRTDAYGAPTLVKTPGRGICIDAPITSKLEYYRFADRAILQWVINPPSKGGPPPPPFYGWKSIYFNGLFNLAGPKEFSVSSKIRQHQLFSLGYNGQAYLDTPDQIPVGWILIINQYGITKESYDFHLRLNNQFSAVGNLYDPVQTQVYGNIHCKTSPEKLVLGFFDLNSYRQYRYYFYPGTGPDNQVVLRRLNHRDFDIPDQNDTTGTRPVFWEYN